MAYTKQTWVRGEKVASVKLNHMEDGISAISANGAIDTANLANAAVTNDKLDQEAVDSNNIRAGAIITPLIYDGAVTLPKLGADVLAELDNKADIDGSYERMTVCNAEQLVSSVGITDQTPYNFRTSGGSVDIGDREELNAVVGVSVPWSQLAKKINSTDWKAESSVTATFGDGEATFSFNSTGGNGIAMRTNVSFVKDHKYVVLADVKSPTVISAKKVFIGGSSTSKARIEANITTTDTWIAKGTVANCAASTSSPIYAFVSGQAYTDLSVRNVLLIDLTLLLGSTIADYIYSLEQANAGAGVAYFRKLFPKPYYAYNSGELLSVKTSAHKMVGFNQIAEVEFGNIDNTGADSGTSKNYIRTKGYINALHQEYAFSWEGNTNTIQMYLLTYDSNKNLIARTQLVSSVTGASGYRKFTPDANVAYIRGFVYGVNAFASLNSINLCINISWDGERDGEYEPYQEWNYPLDSSLTLRGILKLDASNNLYADGDRYLPDGTVERRYGIIDLGTLNWTYNTTAYPAWPYFYTPFQTRKPGWNNLVCQKYPLTSGAYDRSGDKVITGAPYHSNNPIIIRDSAYTDAAAFKAAMSGVYLVYELATPTTETAATYQQTQIVDDFGTEEFVDAAVEANERDVSVPVGNITFYPQNLRKKIEGLPFDFSTLIARTEKAFKATKAYAVNEFLIINNHLYKTRTSIANGATITVGTNVIATTIGAELTAILNS